MQLGIGVIPDAVMSFLSSHKDLGIHTEMFSNGVIDLVKTGVITNAKKSHHQGKIISGFCMGTREVYDFVDDNPQVDSFDLFLWIADYLVKFHYSFLSLSPFFQG